MEKMTALSLVVGVLSCFYAVSAAADGVPVMMWSNKELPSLPDTATGHTTTSEAFHRDYLNKLVEEGHPNLLLFIQDKLSIDDITQYADVYNDDSDGAVFHNIKNLMEGKSSFHLPSVSSPSSALIKLQQNFVGKVHKLSAPYSLDSLPLDQSQKNLVVVDLPQTKTAESGFQDSLKQIDNIVGSVSKDMAAKDLPYAAVYTAEKSSRMPRESMYTGRHLLADDATDYTLFNTSCLMFYARNITVQHCDTTPSDPKKACSDLFILPAKQEPDPSSNCSDETATLIISYGAVGDFESIKFSYAFRNRTARRVWDLQKLDVTFKIKDQNERSVPMVADFIEAPLRFSYHCTTMGPLKEKRPPTNSKTIKVYMDGFQVQYYPLEDGQFGRPNDCVGFFSIGALAGLTVAFILTSILAFGVLMIMNITTMDRFDDPKGKTISVTVSE